MEQGTWVHFYIHGRSDDEYALEPKKLGWLLDLLLADGRFWVADARSIGEYAMLRHMPSAGDSLVYTPIAPPGDDPWQGHPSAFTLSTDDGWISTLEYADTCLVRGVNMTAFITTGYLDWPWGDHLSEEDLVTLFEKGNVEIACHTQSHPRLIPEEAFLLHNDGEQPVAVEVAGGRNTRYLRFYTQDLTGTSDGVGSSPGKLDIRCHPNPARSDIVLSLAAGRAGRLQINVYDVRGRRLRTVFAGQVAAEAAQYRWDACDASGRRLPVGLYLLRAEQGGEVATRKILVLD